MSYDSNEKNVDKRQEELVTLLKDKRELGEQRAAKLQAAIEKDPALREEFQQLQGVLQAVNMVPEIEPSADFRSTLKARIAAAQPQVQSGDRKSGQISPAQKDRPSAPRLSVRMSSNRTKLRSPWARYTVSAAAVVFLAVAVTKFVFFPDVKGPSQTELVQKRLNQRRNAPKWDQILAENRLALPADIPATEVLHIVSHVDVHTRADCLVAYSDEDIQGMRDNPNISDASLQAVLDRSERVALDAKAGSYAIPDRFLPKLGGPGSSVKILRLAGRIEIWSAKTFESYLQGGPIIETVPAPVKNSPPGKNSNSGLPPQAGIRPTNLPSV